MSDDCEPLELFGTIHQVIVSPLDSGRWEYMVEVSPQNSALLTSEDVDELVRFLRPGTGGNLCVTEGQVARAVDAIHIPMMRADTTDEDIVTRVIKALGITVYIQENSE